MTTQSSSRPASKKHFLGLAFATLLAVPACGAEAPVDTMDEIEVSSQPTLIEIDNVETTPTSTTSSGCDGNNGNGNGSGNCNSSGGYGAHNCLVPGPFDPYFEGEEVYVFKSTRRTVAPYLDPTACNGASFTPNVIAGARMTSMKYRQADAMVGNPEQDEIGMGTLCFGIPDLTFPAFTPPIPVRGKVTINGFTVIVDGQCVVANQNYPAAGVHLLSCAIPVINPPAGYSGGLLTTNSVFNVAGVPGFSTGSILTLHLYQQ